MTSRYFSLRSILILLPSLLPFTKADCPSSSPIAPIPGCWGQPGCAYVLVSDLGPAAACKFNYCNCGGTNVPLLPTTVSGTPTVGCDYNTQPLSNNCPTAAATLPGGNGTLPGPVTTGGPTATSTSSGGGGDGGGGTGGNSALPGPVTTGGPISTASNAFNSNAPTSTVLSYQGGALTYTKATFTSLSTITGTTTITAVVTKTGSGNGAPVATYTGPIVVGPQGIFWGPPGVAPNCVWPFCTGSGPADTPNSGGSGGAGGGKFGCQDCAGGGGTNGQGGGSSSNGGGGGNGGGGNGGGGNGGGGSGGGGNGGGGNGGGGNGGGGSGGGGNGGGGNGGGGNGGGGNGGGGNGSGGNGGGGNGGGGNGGGGNGGGGNGGGGNGSGGNGGGGNGSGGNGGGNGGGGDGPPPEPCPAPHKVKRSSSAFITDGGRLVKRAEEVLISLNPLKDAFTNFGSQQSNSLAGAAIDSAEGILTNKFPQGNENAYVTGLEGHFTLPKGITVGTGDNAQKFQSGEKLFWRIRWDYDPAKGPHVNAQFGTKPSSKFAYQLDPSKFPNGPQSGGKAMEQVAKDLNTAVKYDRNKNWGQSEPTWPTTEEQAIKDLGSHFKDIVKGGC